MNSSHSIPNDIGLKTLVTPAAITAAIDTPYVDMSNVVDVEIICQLATAASEPVFSLMQAKDAAGTDAKALPIRGLSTRFAADIADVQDDELWDTHDGVNRITPLDSYDTAGSGIGGNAAEVVFRVHEDDIDDGFTHVKLITAANPARTGSVTALSTSCDYRGDATQKI